MATEEARRHRVELFATILLALAAVGTAWSTYQSTQWRGEQAVANSRASTARIESSDASTRAGQLTQIDIATFTEWVNATVAGNSRLADFYRQRFRAEFVPAFDAWLAAKPLTNPKAPPTPFALPQYQLADAADAKRLSAQADLQSSRANRANQRADKYMLAVVLFAASLFFAGMSTKLHSPRQQEVLLVIGGVTFVATAVFVATFPIMFVT